MSLQNRLKSMKQEGYLIKPIETYLNSLNNAESDRVKNLNSPSQASNCQRANYYARTGVESDGTIEPRVYRIFHNGDGVHERLQDYLEKSGILLMSEVPVINDRYSIQGHTDGYLQLDTNEVGILEIKSINSYGFNALKKPKDEHVLQAMVYLYCSEERRKHLLNTYPSQKEFAEDFDNRVKYYEQHYQHLLSGNKYSREEKIAKAVSLGLKADDILFTTSEPIDKVVFLYECKDNQELKEFTVERDDEAIDFILEKYFELNWCIANNFVPDREGTSKSCTTCKWCNYRLMCFN